MSDQTPPAGGDRPRDPTPEQPVPPTTEFAAVAPEGTSPAGDVPTPSPTSVTSLATDAPSAGSAAGATAPGAAGATEPPPAWKTPAASGLPPAWGDPDAAQDDASTVNQAKNLWGLVPEDRPEVLLGVALAGGVLAAIILRSLAKR